MGFAPVGSILLRWNMPEGAISWGVHFLHGIPNNMLMLLVQEAGNEIRDQL